MVGFNLASLFPARKREAVTKGGKSECRVEKRTEEEETEAEVVLKYEAEVVEEIEAEVVKKI